MICDNVHSVNISDMVRGLDDTTAPYNAATGLYEEIRLESTPCHLGGSRWWFICPKCAKRCGVLWATGAFACQKCQGLRYRVELETLQDRAIRKVIKFRMRFGYQGGGTISPFPAKPKRMRWHTYLKARETDQQLRDIAFGYTAKLRGWM